MAVVSGIAVGDDDVGERGVVERLAKLDLGELAVLCNAVSESESKKRTSAALHNSTLEIGGEGVVGLRDEFKRRTAPLVVGVDITVSLCLSIEAEKS
jgi:hypothetical protein